MRTGTTCGTGGDACPAPLRFCLTWRLVSPRRSPNSFVPCGRGSANRRLLHLAAGGATPLSTNPLPSSPPAPSLPLTGSRKTLGGCWGARLRATPATRLIVPLSHCAVAAPADAARKSAAASATPEVGQRLTFLAPADEPPGSHPGSFGLLEGVAPLRVLLVE